MGTGEGSACHYKFNDKLLLLEPLPGYSAD